MKRSLLFIILSAMLLSSCLILDNYELNVIVHNDLSVEMIYEGELNYVPALDAVLKGEYDDDKKKEFTDVVQSIKDSEGYTSVKNKGKGKIEVTFKKSIIAGSDYYFLDKDFKYYSFIYNGDGELQIIGFELDKDSKKSINELKSKLNGTLCIQVPKKLKVVEHNADKSKKVDKKTMQYFWDLDLNSKAPQLIIK
jgi:hypothetical protein